MNAIILLFLVGVVLLGFEVFVPGAVLGILGSLSLLGGVILAFMDFGAPGGWTALATALGLVGGMLFFEFRILPRTALGKRLFLKSEIGGTSQPVIAVPDSVVDRTGETLTPLSPSGYIMLEGKRYEAFCRSGFVDKGASVRVVGVDNFRLIVSKT